MFKWFKRKKLATETLVESQQSTINDLSKIIPDRSYAEANSISRGNIIKVNDICNVENKEDIEDQQSGINIKYEFPGLNLLEDTISDSESIQNEIEKNKELIIK